jgi:hypothetical protein
VTQLRVSLDAMVAVSRLEETAAKNKVAEALREKDRLSVTVRDDETALASWHKLIYSSVLCSSRKHRRR